MECEANVSKAIEQFMGEADLNEVYLFGGAVLDPLTKENAKVNDYDVCVRDDQTFYEALHCLESKGCNISDVMRTHNIYVVIRHPELGQIDFSCMNPENNGIFNIEKIYAKFRKKEDGYINQVVDKYGAIESIKRGEIRLACNPEEEGAYNILRRFLAVAGKYNLDISKDGPNQEAINAIKDNFAYLHHYIPQDKVRCLSRLFASLRRVGNRQEFIKNLGEQNIFEIPFPEIDKLFNNPSFREKEELNKVETQRELLWLTVNSVPSQDRDNLIDCLRLLAYREAARQDKGVKSFIEEIEQEKTSAKRLDQDILTPLLLFKQGKAL